MARKGQIWSVDMIAGIAIITLILLIFILLWNNTAIRWNNSNDYRKMQTDAVFASESLIGTQGEPKSWESFGNISTAEIDAIGLANGRNELNEWKIKKLVDDNASSYSKVKQRLGLQRYEFGFKVMDLEKEGTYYSFGHFAGALNASVNLDRIVMFNGNPAILHLEVWK